MGFKEFNAMQLDAIGEIMNISLGSSATAVSNMLNHRVDITTPTVSSLKVEDFTITGLEPAMGVEIQYVSGISGSNVMLLKREDVRLIVGILLGSEIPVEEFELNELAISAVCEVMNQMMGAASTALSDFLGRMVNISTPQPFTVDDLEKFKQQYYGEEYGGQMVVVRFVLKIDKVLESEFVNVMSADLARELISGFDMDFGDEEPVAAAPAPEPSNKPLSQEEIERMMGGGAAPAPAPEPSNKPLSQEEIEKMMGGGVAPTPPPAPAPAPVAPPPAAEAPPTAPAPAPVAPPPAAEAPPTAPLQQYPGYPGYPPQEGAPAGYPPPYYGYYPPMPGYGMPPQGAYHQAAEAKVIETAPVQMPAFGAAPSSTQQQPDNLELILSVPLEVSVEIGRARRRVEEILTFSKGSLVVLDKLAGEQVDLLVNGLCVAKGDVVVIDDNFGIRITEVLKQPGLLELAMGKK